MQMERADKIGLGIASAGHVLLFAALSVSWLSADPLKLRNRPIEVSIADEVAFQSAARQIAETPPPPTPGDLEGPPEQAAPTKAEEPAKMTSAETAPASVPAPKPKPEPKKAEKAKVEAKKPPSTSKAEKSRGSKLKLDTSDWIKSDSRADTKSTAKSGAVASSIGPAQKSALDAEIRRQLKPHWKAPTGADVELLRTIVTVRLARDGSLAGNPEVIETVGETASNRAQVRLHQEQAVKAIRLAAPFRLPADLYDGWNFLRLTFDKRLSQ
jgi:outer membrane biosynthesis protein TonB